MNKFRKSLSIVCLLMKMNWKSQLSYMGLSAYISYLAQIIQFSSRFAVIWITMRSFTSLSGFTMWEVFIIYAIELFSYALANCFLQPFRKMKNLLLTGDLDFYLFRPIDPLLFIGAKNFSPGFIAHIILASIILLISSIQLQCATSILFVFTLILIIIIATGIQFGIRCIPAFVSFWLGPIDNLQWIVGCFRELSRYPIKIYPIAIQVLLSSVIPYAFVNYFPSLLLLNKIDIKHGLILLLISIMFSAIMILTTVWMFRKGLSKYESGNG